MKLAINIYSSRLQMRMMYGNNVIASGTIYCARETWAVFIVRTVSK